MLGRASDPGYIPCQLVHGFQIIAQIRSLELADARPLPGTISRRYRPDLIRCILQLANFCIADDIALWEGPIITHHHHVGQYLVDRILQRDDIVQVTLNNPFVHAEVKHGNDPILVGHDPTFYLRKVG